MTSEIDLQSLLQRCESEQLHLSGAIQSFGAMIRIDATRRLVTHVSANLGEFLGEAADTLLGQDSSAIGWLNPGLLDNLPVQPGYSQLLSRATTGPAGTLDVVLVRADDAILIELERHHQSAEVIAIQQFQRPLLTVPIDDAHLQRHHDTLLEAFRTITGIDRAMIYRFNEEWVGEVIAESAAPGLGSYLGLHFPASDIPAIARNLYLVNPGRLIADIEATPVPVVGLQETVPDLTWSTLRSVSPVHLQYLKHMGVRASFSVPIRVANKLWGLVACHHLQPCPLSPEQRNACVSLVNAYAMGLTSYFAGRRLQMIDSLDRRVDGVLEALSLYDHPLDGIEPNARLLMDVISAQGFAMAVGDDVVIAGEGPDMEGMGLIDNWFVNECTDAVATTQRLDALFPHQYHILGGASGMLAIKARSPRSGWVRFYWFRPAEPQEVAWAGNPNKPMVENAGVTMLSPRRSFERWVEIKSGFSRPWSNEDKMTASKFRNILLRWL